MTGRQFRQLVKNNGPIANISEVLYRDSPEGGVYYYHLDPKDSMYLDFGMGLTIEMEEPLHPVAYKRILYAFRDYLSKNHVHFKLSYFGEWVATIGGDTARADNELEALAKAYYYDEIFHRDVVL